MPRWSGATVFQCPDGSPPPCRGAASAAPRRPNPPLDDRTWIVLPFENVARVADIDWLKDASVNLLYLDMSKWRDIRVIDDERVADFIREVPEARGTLTLQSGIAVARRAGAGKLVMGDLLKVGNRTQLVAKVFDVRTGQRVRTVRREATNADSYMPAFGLLARDVLNVAPPEGTSLGSIGTMSVGAYQAYLAGVDALNHWQLDSAGASFTRALSLDSTFALAHYKLALVYGWQSGAGGAEGPRHANAALRLGTSLPPRERNLVTGYAAFANQRYGEACAVFTRMVQADSTDVEAWYNLGECSYHDPVVEPVGGDSMHLAFRSSWNTMLRAFRKTLELDPTYHLAFQHIQDALLASTRPGCRLASGEAVCNPQGGATQGVLRRAADSLVIVPINLTGADVSSFGAHMAEAGRQHARAQNLDEARRAVESWLAAGPSETRPRVAYVRILMRQGQVHRADSVARGIGEVHISRVEDGTFALDRIDLALKSGRAEEAARMAEALRAWSDTLPAGGRNVGILAAAMFGRSELLAPFLDRQINAPAYFKNYFIAAAQSFLGAPVESLYAKEQAVAQAMAASPRAGRIASILGITMIWTDPRERHGAWAATDTLSPEPRIVLMSHLASGDTARFRRALAGFDSLAAAAAEEPDNGFALTGAYAHLAVADTAGALVYLRRFRDQTWAPTPILTNLGSGIAFAGEMWPKMFLLLGDLAAATGQRDEALQAYRLFVAAWSNADPPLQPQVQRARAAIARLGG